MDLRSLSTGVTTLTVTNRCIRLPLCTRPLCRVVCEIVWIVLRSLCSRIRQACSSVASRCVSLLRSLRLANLDLRNIRSVTSVTLQVPAPSVPAPCFGPASVLLSSRLLACTRAPLFDVLHRAVVQNVGLTAMNWPLATAFTATLTVTG